MRLCTSFKLSPAAVPLDGATPSARFDGSRRFARGTRWGTALSHVGSVVVLAIGSACASPQPAAVPRAGGPYFAARPETFEGRVIGAGHCVDFVKMAAGAPRTAAWREGAVVRGNPHVARGTAIATFESGGSYTSESGNHAAIYVFQDDRGIWVYDQWRGQPVHKRLIRFEGGSGSKRGTKSNNGRRFAVIE
jgi:hypothetical protein